MRGIVIGLVVGLAGCWDIPQETIDDIACTNICRCIPELSPEQCQTSCIADLSPVSTECFDFTTASSQQCAAIRADLMDDDGVCEDAPQPEEDE